MGIKFDEDPLAVEQNNYLTKIVNVYIVYESRDWPNLLTVPNFRNASELMEALAHQRNNLVLTLLKQIQNSA